MPLTPESWRTAKTSGQRGYTYRWQQARAAYLQEHPLCTMHMELGKVVEATVVDHKTPHRGDNILFWQRSNWQSLCKPCHDTHKQRQEHGNATRGAGADGWPV